MDTRHPRRRPAPRIAGTLAALLLCATGTSPACTPGPKPAVPTAQAPAAPVVPAVAPRDPGPLVQDAEYPQVRYFRDAQDPWYTFRTDTGCLYYRSEPADVHRTHAVVSARWEGEACTPGEAIRGKGTLTEDIEVVENRDEWTSFRAGTMEDGVFQGTVVFRSTQMTGEAAIEMHGGCEAEAQSCRPRPRAAR